MGGTGGASLLACQTSRGDFLRTPGTVTYFLYHYWFAIIVTEIMTLSCSLYLPK